MSLQEWLRIPSARLIDVTLQIAYIAYFYSVEVLIEQLHFLLVIVVILAKQGNYIVNSARVREFLI